MSPSAQITMVTSLRLTLVNVFSMYVRAHAAHWNVEGAAFPQLHQLFGAIYEDVHGSVDPLAEFLRAHQVEAPCSVLDFANEAEGIPNLTATMSDTGGYTGKALLQNLQAVNDRVIDDLQNLYEVAEKGGDCGLANYAQDRLIAHNKWAWQLRATLG